MNYPPGNPPPMSPPPAGGAYAPPPRKSSAMKWVLIGCGGITLLGVLCCGGFGLMGYLAFQKAKQEIVAKVKPIVEKNETVKQEVGEIRSFEPRWSSFSTEQKSDGSGKIRGLIDISGDRGKGVLTASMITRKDGKTVYIALAFESEAGKKSSIGTWKIEDDGHGNSSITPFEGEPPEDE